MVSLGPYPEISLANARGRRDDARSQLRKGKDPSSERAAAKDATKHTSGAAFPQVAAAWLDFKHDEWADETYRKAKYVTETYLIPLLRRESISTLRDGRGRRCVGDHRQERALARRQGSAVPPWHRKLCHPPWVA